MTNDPAAPARGPRKRGAAHGSLGSRDIEACSRGVRSTTITMKQGNRNLAPSEE